MHRRRTPSIVVLATALLVTLAACGDTEDDSDELGGAEEAPEDTSGEATDGGDTGDDGETAGDSSLEFVALDIEFEPTEASAAAGELDVSLVNEGEIQHTWLVEGHEDELELEVQQNGDTDQGTITLESGSYTYYCDVPGHRSAGMEGTLEVE